MGVLLKAVVGFSQRARLTVLVWATSSPGSAKLLAETHRPAFDFSMEANNLGFILNSIDKLLFLDTASISGNLPAFQILHVLMARDNRKDMDEALSTTAYNASFDIITFHLDNSEQIAMSRLSTKRITLIDGPEASGKTMLAAIFGVMSIQSGEKVTFLSKTKTSLKKLFVEVIEATKELQLPFATIEKFSLTGNTHPLPTEEMALETILSKIEWTNKYNFSAAVKATPSSAFPKSSSIVLTAQFTTYDELDSVNLEKFVTTLLICIEAERANDHSIFAACGLFSTTLKKVALIRNTDKIPVDVTSRHMNHLRSLQDRNLMQYWVAKYLNKEMKDAKLPMFADVTDGIYVQDANGIAKANHHNMVAILDILQSMINHKLPREKAVVITFSRKQW
jgi:hypothetical protein